MTATEKQPETELERTRRFLQRLLNNVGTEGECGYCHRRILWVRHKSGKGAPYDPDGEIHFSTCPDYPGRKGAQRHE